MPRDPRVLYPIGYAEPVPPAPPPDDETTGRDFARLRTIIRAAVPPAGPPMSMHQIAHIVYGRQSQNGSFLRVGVDAPASIRAAARDDTPTLAATGIVADSACTSILRSEARVIFDEVVAEREATWTFQE